MVVKLASVLVRTRWMHAARSNLPFFCCESGITLVGRCNLLLVWAPPLARESLRMSVHISVRLAHSYVPALWCLVIWWGVLLCRHTLVIKPGLSPHLKPSIMLLDPRRWRWGGLRGLETRTLGVFAKVLKVCSRGTFCPSVHEYFWKLFFPFFILKCNLALTSALCLYDNSKLKLCQEHAVKRFGNQSLAI